MVPSLHRSLRSGRRSAATTLLFITALVVLATIKPGQTTRVSTASDRTQANSASLFPAFAAGGRYVAFQSEATNLAQCDTNASCDVFVKNLGTGQTSMASKSASGTPGNDDSYAADISAGGRYVAFASAASNLVGADTNERTDIFVKDLTTQGIVCASLRPDSAQANGQSQSPTISDDGRYVAFRSYANNLVPGDVDSHYDIFAKDLVTKRVALCSVTLDGTQANNDSYECAISANGRYVAFDTIANNLTANDYDGMSDIFVKDLQTGSLTLASANAAGVPANLTASSPSISWDGRYVAFSSQAKNLVGNDKNHIYDIYVKDMQTGQIAIASTTADGTLGNAKSIDPSISADGRYVAFTSLASNFVSGDSNGTWDVYVKDLLTGDIRRASVKTSGIGLLKSCDSPSLCGDAHLVAFQTLARLVSGDTNGAYDVYAHGTGFGITQ